MTAEEYLNEHCKPEDWNNLEERLKDSILTEDVIEYMERYAALRIQEQDVALLQLFFHRLAKYLADDDKI